MTPGISRDGLRQVLPAVRAEACGRFRGSVMLAEALAEAQGDPAKHTVRVETLFAEASRKQLPRQLSRKSPWKKIFQKCRPNGN